MTVEETAAHFVDGAWLEAHLRDPGLRIIQVGGDTYFARQHIPGALLLPYAQLVETREQVPGLRPGPETLAALFGSCGIAVDTRVVAYDLSGGMDASRLVWTLATLGNDRGLVLDGGLSAWFREERPMTGAVPGVAPVVFTPRPNPEWEADLEQVFQATEPGAAVQLVDTRTANEYQGLVVRGPRGHLAGAVHFDWIGALIDRNDPRLRDRDTLRAMLGAAGVDDPGREIILYCETAHRAAQTWLLLRSLGFSRVRLYDGSMAEWRALDLPVVPGNSPR